MPGGSAARFFRREIDGPTGTTSRGNVALGVVTMATSTPDKTTTAIWIVKTHSTTGLVICRCIIANSAAYARTAPDHVCKDERWI